MKENIWVFDVDGVITDQKTKEITNPFILEKIHKLLSSGEKVALNTGRSAEWLEMNVINKLREHIISKDKNSQLLANIISVCEMGNVIVKYQEAEKPDKEILNKNIIPGVLDRTIKDLVSSVYKDSMFIDRTKEVILTIEMRDDYSYEDYKKRRDEFQKEISIIIKNYHPHLQIRPSSTTIAIDIMPIESGKNLGAERIIDWCRERGVDSKKLKFICIGDSPSDIDMSDLFYAKKLDTEFVYVGESTIEKREYPITITQEKFTQGTIEYLKKMNV